MNRRKLSRLIGLIALLAGHFVLVSGPAHALLPILSNPVSAGSSSTCAIRASDDLYCVGSNLYGLLGSGKPISKTSDPLKVIGISKVSAVTVGATSACAVTHAGELFCWGENFSGQLGVGDTQHRETATRVSILSNVSQVAVGENFACALTSNGSLWCWGANDVGQQTNKSKQANLLPVLASQIPTGITQVAISGKRVCVLATEIYCWGEFANSVADSVTKNWVPTKVPGSTGAKSIELGNDFGCFTLESSVSCWGANEHGQLGVGNRVPSDMPSPVTGITSVKDLAVGKSFACVLDTNSDTYCWGDNLSGQLVAGSKVDQLTRVPTGAPKAANIEAGSDNLCLLKLDAAVTCYGDSSAGQSGYLLTSELILTNSTQTSTAKISTGLNTTCAISSAGQLTCWGEIVPVVPVGSAFTEVSVGDSSACAVSVDKRVLCWGSNTTGQLGNNTTRSSSVMTEIALPSTSFTKVAVGYRHACAVSEDGLTYCWGDNSRQQLGYVGADSRVPVAVPGIGTGVSVSSGDYHSCVIQNGGSSTCWGDNSKRQISSSNMNQLPPTALVSDNPLSSLALGPANSCFLDSTKSLKCIGDNSKKQSPGIVAGSFTSVSTGGNTVCALKIDEKVYCFGSADSSKLALVSVDTSVPTRISKVSFAAVSVGAKHVCVIDLSGALSCWGSNSGGQLTSSFGFPKAFSDPVVTVAGTQAVGESLRAQVTGTETKSLYSYLWKRATTSDGLIASLTSQTADSYHLSVTDVGKYFAVEVKQSKWGTTSAAYSSELTAAISAPVRFLFTPTPTITGTVKAGRILSAKSGRWDSGAKLSYQWYRGKTAIKGATKATFSLTSADVGKQLYVAVSATKTGLPKVIVKSLKTAKVLR